MATFTRLTSLRKRCKSTLRSGMAGNAVTGHDDSVSCLQFDDSKVVSGSLDSSLKVTTALATAADGSTHVLTERRHDCVSVCIPGELVLGYSHRRVFGDARLGQLGGTQGRCAQPHV